MAFFNLLVRFSSCKHMLTFDRITTCISPKALLLKHVNGKLMEGKLVNFAICLNIDTKIKNPTIAIIEPGNKDAYSVNQTMYNPTRFCPVALNMQTNPAISGGQKADGQAAVWAACGLIRLRQLIGNGNEKTIPAMPLLQMHESKSRTM